MITNESELWVPDDATNVCQVCNINDFYQLFSRHHCRACGKVRKNLSHLDSHWKFISFSWCVKNALKSWHILKINMRRTECVIFAIFSANSQVGMIGELLFELQTLQWLKFMALRQDLTLLANYLNCRWICPFGRQ